MDGPRNYHTKGNKSDREKQVSCEITNMWNPIKNDTKELTKQERLQDFETELMITKGEICMGQGQTRGLGLTYTHYCI